jgi:hypothetical protein
VQASCLLNVHQRSEHYLAKIAFSQKIRRLNLSICASLSSSTRFGSPISLTTLNSKTQKENSFSSSPQPLIILQTSLLAFHPILLFFPLSIYLSLSSPVLIYPSLQKPATLLDLQLLLLASPFFLSFDHKFPFSLTQPPPSLLVQHLTHTQREISPCTPMQL